MSILPGAPFPRPTPFPRPQPAPIPTPQPIPGPVPGFPGADSARLANTQAQQIDGIKQGLSSGALSETEAARLLEQQARISDAISRAQADGNLSLQERSQLDILQSQAGMDLFQAKNNCEYGRQPWVDPSTTAKQVEQLDSIAKGVRGGDLSGRESASLLRGQAGIARTAAETQADGQVDSLERLEVGMRQVDAGYGIDSSRQNQERAPHGRLSFPQLFF